MPTDGRLIGRRYRLLHSLGRGGMGVVWAGRDEVLDRDVAVKEVTPPPGLDDIQRAQLRARTLREARAAARIRSTAAVTVYDVVEEDGRPWIVMELLPPRTLADVLRQDGPLSVEEASRIGLRLLDALAAAHAAGVLHRDVKPANVLYDSTGQAVLTDFGIASLEGDSSMTTTGMIVGSPGYVAPERAMGKSPSPASDLWSLGVTLATALHGRSPFERDTPLATLVSAVQERCPRGPPAVLWGRCWRACYARRRRTGRTSTPSGGCCRRACGRRSRGSPHGSSRRSTPTPSVRRHCPCRCLQPPPHREHRRHRSPRRGRRPGRCRRRRARSRHPCGRPRCHRRPRPGDRSATTHPGRPSRRPDGGPRRSRCC
jgi:serine/threonine protein kinase